MCFSILYYLVQINLRQPQLEVLTTNYHNYLFNLVFFFFFFFFDWPFRLKSQCACIIMNNKSYLSVNTFHMDIRPAPTTIHQPPSLDGDKSAPMRSGRMDLFYFTKIPNELSSQGTYFPPLKHRPSFISYFIVVKFLKKRNSHMAACPPKGPPITGAIQCDGGITGSVPIT